MKDLHHNLKIVQALEAIVVNNDTEGTGAVVDLQGYESCEIAVSVGASGDTLSGSVYMTLKIQHGDAADLSDAAAPDETEILGAISGTTAGAFALIDDPAEDSTVVKAGYIGSKRYVRLFVDITGTHTSGTPIGAVAILGSPRHAPVA